MTPDSRDCAPLGIARPVSRAWIETKNAIGSWIQSVVSPGQLAGRGLKLTMSLVPAVQLLVSPGQLAGRGLKR